LKQYATKQDLETAVEQLKAEIRRIENKMATKEQIEALGISVEDSGREMVQFLLEHRGYKCVAEMLRVDSDYEFDIYCNVGVLTVVVEAKVRAEGRDVEKTLERAQEFQRKQPEKISGRLVPVLYSLVAEPPPSKRQRSSRYGSSKVREKLSRWRRFWGRTTSSKTTSAALRRRIRRPRGRNQYIPPAKLLPCFWRWGLCLRLCRFRRLKAAPCVGGFGLGSAPPPRRS